MLSEDEYKNSRAHGLYSSSGEGSGFFAGGCTASVQHAGTAGPVTGERSLAGRVYGSRLAALAGPASDCIGWDAWLVGKRFSGRRPWTQPSAAERCSFEWFAHSIQRSGFSAGWAALHGCALWVNRPCPLEMGRGRVPPARCGLPARDDRGGCAPAAPDGFSVFAVAKEGMRDLQQRSQRNLILASGVLLLRFDRSWMEGTRWTMMCW